MNKEKQEWNQIKSNKINVYQLDDHPEIIYVIKIRDNENMIVHEDGYDLATGKVEFLNDAELKSKYKLNNFKNKSKINMDILNQFVKSFVEDDKLKKKFEQAGKDAGKKVKETFNFTRKQVDDAKETLFKAFDSNETFNEFMKKTKESLDPDNFFNEIKDNFKPSDRAYKIIDNDLIVFVPGCTDKKMFNVTLDNNVLNISYDNELLYKIKFKEGVSIHDITLNYSVLKIELQNQKEFTVN